MTTSSHSEPKEVTGPDLVRSIRMMRNLVDGPRREHSEHGDIMRLSLRLGGANVFFINRSEWIEQVLVRNRDAYNKDRVFQWLRPIFHDSILVSEGEKWRRHRRLIAPAFHRANLLRHAEAMVACADDAVERLTPGVPFDLKHWMMETALDVALRTMFGSELGERGAVVGAAVDDMLAYADATMKVGRAIPTWLPVRAARRLRRGTRNFGAVVDSLIAERRRSGVARDDLLGLLLDARDEDGTGMSDDEVREEVTTLLLAGHETTALAMTYTILLLGRFPYALEPVLTEISEVLGDRAPTSADLPKLTQLHRLIREALRLYPPAAIIGREAVRDDEIAGQKIRPGDQVIISIWALHHDERYFPDPWVFDPSRWNEEFERTLPRFAFMPFGGGSRVCIGDQFALMESTLVLARLLQRLRFRLIDPREPDLELTITMRPIGTHRAVAWPRAGS